MSIAGYSRREVLKTAAAAALATTVVPVFTTGAWGAPDGTDFDVPQKTPVIGSRKINGENYQGSVAKVYFSPVIDANSLIKLYTLVNEGIYGKVAIKLHTGEKNGPNIIPPQMVKALQSTIPNSEIVETNTLYEGDRYTTKGHRETLEVNAGRSVPLIFWMSMAMSLFLCAPAFISRKWQWGRALPSMTPCWY